MNPESSASDDNALFGNGITGLLDCALDSGLEASVPEVPAHWEPPTPSHIAVLLPQYQIEHLIGRGGMGAVYKGRQITLQRPVAIKVLPAELARNAEFVARFHREAQLLASLSHQGIVTIFDFGQTTEGHLYFVMEYVDGTDLYRLIHKSNTKLDAKEALSLTVQICEAMQYAHDKGVVHRDIKPANVLVTKDGRAKLADFGLAMKPADPDAVPQPPKPEVYFDTKHSPDVAAMRFTAPGAAMGTPDYAAPEVYEGRADERSDIYALGIMLYEMLTGAPPKGYFQLPSSMALVDHRVDNVVVKALEIDPGARYQKVDEMKSDVQAATQPLAKPPPQPPTQVRVQPNAVFRPPARPSAVPVRARRSMGARLIWAAVLLALAGGGYLLWTSVQKHPEWLAFVKARVSTNASQAKPTTLPQATPPSPSTSAVATSTDPVLGRWWWPGDYLVAFTADGKFQRSDGSRGVWSREPGKTLPCEYVLRWEGVNVDRLTLNKEANVLDGFIVNYRNARITAYRVPENPEPPLGGATVMRDEGFTPLLDRDHTSGWQHCGEGSMRNKDGVFITSTPVGVREPWGIYWYSARRFSDFVLRVEFAVDALGTNSGVLFSLPYLGTAKPALFPSGSYEAEISGTETGCIPNVIKDRKFPLPVRSWNDMEVTVNGTSVTVKVNGQTISAHTFTRSLSGYIGLQNLGCCGSTYFRNVRIKELNTAPVTSASTPPTPKEIGSASLLKEARAHAAQVADAGHRSSLLKDIAASFAKLGDMSEALTTAKQCNDAGSRGRAFGAAAIEQAARGDVEGAIITAQLATEPFDEDMALVEIVSAEYAKGQRDTAERVAKVVTTSAGRARCLAEAALDLRKQGLVAAYEAKIAEARTLAQTLGKQEELQRAFRSIVTAQVKAGDVAGAKASVPLYKGHRFANPLINVIGALADTGDFSAARDTANRAGFTMYPWTITLARIAKAQREAGRFADARRTVKDMSYPDHKLIALTSIAVDEGNLDEARTHADGLKTVDHLDFNRDEIHAKTLGSTGGLHGKKHNILSAWQWIQSLSQPLARGYASVSLAELLMPSITKSPPSATTSAPPPGTPTIRVFAYDLKALVAACLATKDDRSHDTKRALLTGYRDGLLKEGRAAAASNLNAYRAALSLCAELINVAAEREIASSTSEWQSRASALRASLDTQVSTFRTTFEKTALARP